MQWYWRVRIYNHLGNYACGQLTTPRDLKYIEVIQNFYHDLTHCKMVIEGMQEKRYENFLPIDECFKTLWKE